MLPRLPRLFLAVASDSSVTLQEGYGAFSIGVSGVEATRRYIRNQAEHHRNRTFREELRTMLRKHGLEYEERMLD